MARISSDPVAPAPNALLATTAVNSSENIEALKRRFIRQNRELAKNNSSQSLRIRSLELEVSKLLADNLDLREQNLALQNEVHNAQKQASSWAVRRMKCDLREKIAELSGLIDGLDEESHDERPEVEKARILSPSQRQYRERQPLAELMQDAVMPTIAEDKHYPRQTLGTDDIRAIRLSDQSGTSASPDIGPPPVAHFDCEDASKDNESQQAPQPSPKAAEEELLPTINLDTRRRRRESSSSKLEIRRHSILAQSPVKPDADASSTTMLKTGAKRKLADRETEKQIKPPTKDDFTFSKRAPTNRASVEEDKKPVQVEVVSQATTTRGSVPVAPKPTRRVLGEKSVNTSPKKRVLKAEDSLKDASAKPPPRLNTSQERPPTRGRRTSGIPSSLPMPSPPAEEVAPVIDIPAPQPDIAEQPAPYTPAPMDDIFSPTSEPSTQNPNGARDTPPPADLSALSNTTESGQRPSRRARSAVNYAEPSLIAKMRRPDKQMVDAISGLQNPKRAMNPSGLKRKSTSEGSLRASAVKQEPIEDDESWKDVSHLRDEVVGQGSPLREKSTDEHLTTTKTIEEATAPLKHANLSSSLQPVKKSREGEPSIDEEAAVAAKKLEELDLYDFKSSSPPPGSSSARSSPPIEDVKGGKGAPKGSRRHSMAPAKEAASTTTTGSSRVSSRRRSMMV